MNYKIDDVMVMGFSQGAGLTLLAGIKYSEIVDIIVPFAGFYPENLISDEMLKTASKNGLKAIIAHCKDDKVVLPKESETAYEIFTKNGIYTELIYYEGTHKIDLEVLQKALETLKN